MAKKFRDLVRDTLSEEEQGAAHAASRAMLLELNLRQIREKVPQLSQEEVAQLLEVTQPYISKLELKDEVTSNPVARATKAAAVRGRGTTRRSKPSKQSQPRGKGG